MRFILDKKVFQSLTFYLIAICAIFFIWDGIESFQSRRGIDDYPVTAEITPLQRVMLFDYPRAMSLLDQLAKEYDVHSMSELKAAPLDVQKKFYQISSMPIWAGIVNQALFHLPSAPVFEKIREGQIWRLFTPSLLHRDLLHILFNMAWLGLLGFQIEARLKKEKMILLILLLGIFSNVAQYLTGGPYFLGFSGVITGLAGFIWSRQKVAPEEGYPLPKSTLRLIFYFVLSMVLLGWAFLTLQALGITQFSFPIANTAHVVGGIFGMALGRMKFFRKRVIA